MTRMYKVFRNSWCDSAYLAMNLRFLPDAVELKVVSADQNFRVLSYRRLPGDWRPTHVGQLMSLSRALRCLVKAGIVHGDIRLCNIIFAPIDASDPAYVSHLIDFDVSRPVGSTYPVQLSSNIRDGARHPDALLPNAIMQHAHDYHSFLYVLRLFQPESESLRTGYRQAVDGLSCGSRSFFKRVRAALKPMYNEPIELTPLGRSLLNV